MYTITFFAPKGGTGRTTAVMATATAFIESGRRVGVLDMTEESRLSPKIGLSTIRRWQDSMLATGVELDQLAVASAWDHESFRRAKQQLLDARCTRILIDTPKMPNKLIEQLLLESYLTVMPFNGYFEASWVSHWVTTHFCPARKMFGLATGLTGTDEHQAVQKEALYGSPMLKTGLPRSNVFANQLVDGNFYGPKAGSGAFSYSDAELLQARSAATDLIEEMNRLIKSPNLRGYRAGKQLATGHPLAHLQALHATSPEAFC